MEPLIGAFIFPDAWQAWSLNEAGRIFDSLAEMGVNAICTESESYRDDLLDLSHQAGLKWVGAISCFSDHGHGNQLLLERPELWPVGADGKHRPQMEWYLGVTPTFEDYNASRLALAEQLVRDHDLDGFMLDFIRWPIHWELEIRPGAPPPLQASFDPHTLSRFQAETGITLPASLIGKQEMANWILTHQAQAWVDFKCRVITRFVEQASQRLRQIKGKDFQIGIYALPMPPHQLEALAGQRLADLAPLVDLVAPMAYHAIVHQPPDWVNQVLAWATPDASGKLLPVLQVDSSEGAEIGADWGPPVPVSEWDALLQQVLSTPGLAGLVAFTGTALFRDGRGAILKQNLL